jgi:hypothetical protein
MVAITIDPKDTLARAMSRRAPPATISARTDFIKGARGERSTPNLKMFVGVFMNGTINLSAGAEFTSRMAADPPSPNALVKVWYLAASIAASWISGAWV